MTAVSRNHEATENVVALTYAPNGFRERARQLLVLYAEKHQCNGMFDDRPSIPSHYAARWEPLTHAVGHIVPQELADQLAELTQEAIEWFHDPAHVLLGDPTVRVIPDDEVHTRIMGMQYAMDKEVMRINGGGQIMSLVNPETMEGYDQFIEWYELSLARRMTSPSYSLEALGFYAETVERYDLTKLPYEQQRALVERWERAHIDYLAAHLDVGYDVDGGYLRQPYRIFDREELKPASWSAYDPSQQYTHYFYDYDGR